MKSRWPIWRIVLAYVVMACLALLSVWVVDQKVHRLPAVYPAINPIAPINK